MKKKLDRREAVRERKALSAARLERAIEAELLERLKSKAYGDAPLNVNEDVWRAVLDREKKGKARVEADVDLDEDDMVDDETDEEELEEEGEWGEREFVSDLSGEEDGLSDLEDAASGEEDESGEEDDDEEDGSGEDEQSRDKTTLGKRKAPPKTQKPAKRKPEKKARSACFRCSLYLRLYDLCSHRRTTGRGGVRTRDGECTYHKRDHCQLVAADTHTVILCSLTSFSARPWHRVILATITSD